MACGTASKAQLLYELRDELLEVLEASTGGTFKGVAQAARVARRRSLLSNQMMSKLISIDFAYNCVRHLTVGSKRDFLSKVKMEVNQHFVPDGFVPDGLPDVGEGPSWSKGADSSGSVPDVGLTDVGEGPLWSKDAAASGSVPDVGLTDVGDGPSWSKGADASGMFLTLGLLMSGMGPCGRAIPDSTNLRTKTLDWQKVGTGRKA